MNLSMKQKQTQRHREQACGYQAWGWERDGLGFWDQQVQTIIYIDWIDNTVLLNTGNYIQYPVINQNGKEREQEYIQWNHFVVQEKLTQRCKSTVLE